MRCGAFNSSITVHPNKKVSPCCIFDFKHFKNIDEIDLSDPWKDLKDGKGCSACKKPGNDYKNYFNEYLDLEKFSLQHLDIRNNNLCNFECIICNDFYSSKWAERQGSLKKFQKTEFDLPLDDVNKIYFAGGEPLLNSTHWEILDRIIDPKNVSLFYSTNLSVIKYKAKSVVDYWPRFKKVNVNVSLDGVGELGEELRFGLKISELSKNLNAISSIVNVRIMITVDLLNVWFLDDIERFAKSHNVDFGYSILYSPDFLSISALPKELKDKIPKVKSLNIEHLINEDNSHLFLHTIAYILLQDKLKNTKIFDKMPFKDYAISKVLK